ncbi:hypothetical protein GCM10023353_39950 [Tomitella cavernea]|uniref:Uncharacterized protein n=1 Tax=Tomitella cavernea TaxID=1387982 RepID=A0ABP9D4R5_9ACTN
MCRAARMERASTWRARRVESGAAAHREQRWNAAGQRLDVLAGATGTTAHAKWGQVRGELEQQRESDAAASRAHKAAQAGQGRPSGEHAHRAREGRKFGENRLTNNRMTRGIGANGGRTHRTGRSRDDERGR